MSYTVWSRGRQIGETDLGFLRIVEQFASGWFHPNADGERVMAMIASPSPVMRAYMHREAVDASGEGFVLPELKGSTLFADLAEAFQHLQALDLELRREDGSVVPTSDVGFQDTHQLLALAAEEMEEREGEHEDEAGDDEDDEEDRLGDDGSWDDISAEWTPDEFDAPRYPRYQIHVELLRPHDVPGRVVAPFRSQRPD